MAYFNGVWYLESDEPRPENPLPGACIIEIDTSKVYFYSSRKNTWYEWGAESNAASTLSITWPSMTLGNTLNPGIVEPGVETEELPESITEGGEGE